MATIYIIFILFMAFPAALVLLRKAAIKHGLITTTYRIRFTGKAKSLKTEVYAAGALVTSIAMLILLAGYNLAGGNSSVWLVGGVFTLIVTSTLVLSFNILRASAVFRLSPTAYKWFASLLTLLVVFASSVYADAFIAQGIGIPGTELVAAQRALTILFLPVIWAFVMSGAMLPLYFIAALSWIWYAFTDSTAEQRRLKFLMLGHNNPPLRSNRADIHMILFVGLAFCPLIPLNAVSLLTQDHTLDKLANQATVWASFHLKHHECFPGATEGTVFALVDANRVVAATPEKRIAYSYQIKDCTTP